MQIQSTNKSKKLFKNFVTTFYVQQDFSFYMFRICLLSKKILPKFHPDHRATLCFDEQVPQA